MKTKVLVQWMWTPKKNSFI